MTPSSKTYAWQRRAGASSRSTGLPEGFILMTDAQPLLSVLDCRWIAHVFEIQSGTEGLLLYEDNREVAHLTADETIGMLPMLFVRRVLSCPVCDPTISAAHAQTMEQLRSLWWMQETTEGTCRACPT